MHIVRLPRHHTEKWPDGIVRIVIYATFFFAFAKALFLFYFYKDP